MPLWEYKDIIDLSRIPRRGKYLRYYLLGFIDAEGCFSVSIKKLKTAKFGYVLDPVFTLTQHKKNRVVLELLKRTLNAGRIIEKSGQKDLLVFVIDNRRLLREKLINFLDKYKPIVKWEDYQKFKEIVLAMEHGEHRTREGFERLVKLAYEMNMQGKQRRYKLKEILSPMGSSETVRRASPEQ